LSKNILKNNNKNFLLLIIFIFFIVQLLLGATDSLESRSNHAEDLAHTSHSGANIVDDFQCNDNPFFVIGENGCWHYPSRYALSSTFFYIILLFFEGFIALKISAVILTIIEGLLIHSLVLKNIDYRSANISILVYLSLPSVFYYAQMPSVHISLISVLIAGGWAIPNIFDHNRHTLIKLISWLFLISAPLFSPLTAFAWAGFSIFILICQNNTDIRKYLFAFFLIIFPILAYLVHLKFNTYIGINDAYMSGRFNDRAGFNHLLELNSWLLFVDRITLLFGPLLFLLLFSITNKKFQIVELNTMYFAPILGTFFMGLFSISVFNLTFLSCCRYFAYPLSASIALLFPIFCNNIKFSNEYIAIFMISLLFGVSLHALPTNYSDRSIQEYADEYNLSDDDLVVIIDNNFDNYNALKWQLSSQRIEIDSDLSEDIFNYTVQSMDPDYIILSNQTNSLDFVHHLLSNHNYCDELIETNNNVPENFENGYLSDFLPVTIWARCI